MTDSKDIENLKKLQQENANLIEQLKEAEEMLKALRSSCKTVAGRISTEEDSLKHDPDRNDIGNVIVSRDITERNRAEESLCASEERFRLAINATHAMVYDLSVTTRQVNSMAGIFNLLGYESTEVELTLDWWNRQIHAEDLEKCHSALQEMLISHKNHLIEYRVRHKDGRLLHVEDCATMVLDGIGNPVRTVGIVVDITERKVAQETLRYQAAILETVNDAVIGSDLSFHIQYWNKSAERIYGWTAEEVLGKLVHDVLRMEISEEKRVALAKNLENGNPVPTEIVHLSKTNQRLVIEGYTIPVKDLQGNITSYVSINREITDRKLAEENLRASEAAGRTAAYRLQTIMDTAPVAICVASDVHCYNIIGNAAAHAMLGVPMEENISMTPEKNQSVPYAVLRNGKEVDGPDLPMQLAASTGQSIYGEEWEILRTDGSRISILMSASPLRDVNGDINGAVGTFLDITEIKKVERALRESEEIYRELVKNARGLIFNQDTDGRFTFANEYALDFFGYKEEEIIGKTAIETVTPENDTTGKDLVQMVENIYADPDKYSINVNENIKKNGERVWIEWHNKALFDKNGNKEGHLCVGFDITERKRAEEALLASEAKLRGIMQSTNESIWLFNYEGEVLHANQTALNRLGLPADKVIGKLFSKLLPPELSNTRMKLMREVFETGKQLEFEDERNGMHFLHNLYPILDDTSKVTAVVSYSRDITERKKAEHELLEAQQKLNIALENANVGLWDWNLKTDEVIFDERMLKMFGLKAGMFGNTYAEFENLIHEEDVPHFQNAIKKSLDHHLHLETLFRIKTNNGKPRYFSTRALANKDKDGNKIGFTGVCFDITGLKEGTEQLILKLNEELLRSNKELQQFAYVASHDLQEPLRMVTSFTQLLAQRYKDKLDNDAHEFIHFAVDGARRMQDLITALLAYSRIQTRGKEFACLDINELLKRAMGNLRARIEETKALITSDELPSISVDGGQITQLLQNLIGNALKFNENIPEIHISCKEDNDNYIFSVKDNGIGIEEQFFERIFIIFQRLSRKAEYEGTGIGLSICKSIVERHGGRIWVESEYGKGTTFYFTIPRGERNPS